MRGILSSIALFVLVAGCDSGSNVNAPPISPNNDTPAKGRAPDKGSSGSADYGAGSVIEQIQRRVDREWPTIEKEGRAFAANFREAEALKKEGDRIKLGAKVEEARQHYENAIEAWAEINNWIADQEDDGKINAKTAEKCRQALNSKERIVTGWGKQAKALKEFSLAK